MAGTADLDRFVEHAPWNGKRAMLEWLRPRLRRSRIPAGLAIHQAHWRERPAQLLDVVAQRLGTARLVVRSDHADEDAACASNAGRYRTCLDVDGADRRQLAAAIDAVFASYGPPRRGAELFVQHQVARVRAACVAFTHALPDGAPYYVLSLAPGPRSDPVTRGDADVETWYLARDVVRADALPPLCRIGLAALREVEAAVGLQPCEIEMVIDADATAWLLQARPLPVAERNDPALAALRRATEQRLAATPQPPLLGLMPDWNPAELLGEHPRPLARELFDTLITRRAWRIGRAALGYAPVDGQRLLQVHAGRPYVDVRASFHSLLPARLDRALGERVLEAAGERLRAHPELHDKVEFEVVFSALTCGLPEHFAARYPALLEPGELAAFAAALRGPTLAALDAERTARMLDGFARDLQLAPPSPEPARLRHWLARLELRTAARFALVARQAFAVDALLRSAVEVGALDAAFLAELKEAATAGVEHAIGGDDGHVRAGTFEIAAPARREFGGGPFAPGAARAVEATRTPDAAAARRLRDALRTLELPVAPDALFAHYRRLLHAREFGKFVLAHGVSLALDALATHAQTRGLGRDDAGWLGLDELLDAPADARGLRARIEQARMRHALEGRLRMPLLITDARLDLVHHAPGQANYLGRGRVAGRPAVVDAATHPDQVPVHAIVAIASANPGYDWIFVRQPAALVTAFGGPNSHMAIRCAEAGVPALLGLGPEAFRRIAGAAHLSIDFDCRTWTTP